MLAKRLLTDEELDKYLLLKETKGDASANKYMKSLQDELFNSEDPELNKKKEKKYESKRRK